MIDPPENTVKPGFEIEPMATPKPPSHDPMDAHWQALIAERDNLKKACTAFECAANAYRAERDKLKARDWDLENDALLRKNDKLVERVSELEGALEKIVEEHSSNAIHIARAALEKIKFRNLPGTTNHELAKEALSRTSEEA
jgi:hypothetical protein